MSARATSSAAVGFNAVGKDSNQDVKTYLVALYSYADQVAINRYLSFEKHLLAVMGLGRRAAGQRRRRCRIS